MYFLFWQNIFRYANIENSKEFLFLNILSPNLTLDKKIFKYLLKKTKEFAISYGINQIRFAMEQRKGTNIIRKKKKKTDILLPTEI
jgi:hypothetical protein